MDGHLTAAKHAFIALILAAAAFIYLAIGEIQRNANYETKLQLSLILAARDIATGLYKPHQATDKDIASFSDGLGKQYHDLYITAMKKRAEQTGQIPELTELMKRFGAAKNDLGVVIDDIPVPYSILKKCDALLIQPDTYFFFYNFNYLRPLDWNDIYSRNVRYLIFDNDCQSSRNQRFFALIIPANNGTTSLALPHSALSIFPSIFRWAEETGLYLARADRDRLLPDRVKKYFPYDEDLYILNIRTIELLAIEILGEIDGKYYLVDELSKSLIDIYDKDHSKASLGGIDFNSLDFLRIVPIWMFMVSYYYWRQLRALQARNLDDQTWTPLDTDDLIGVSVSYLWAFTPAIATALVYSMYPSVFNLIAVVFGYEISPLGIWKWQFQEARPIGHYGLDYMAFATLGVLALHTFVIYICTVSSLRIIRKHQKVSVRKVMSDVSRQFGTLARRLRH
ncbi:hypothetical protein [Mesorhizobium onobrychidis]|uniref:Uncharacterized protein n=1 Tax=Mesorhizobium onobrychidis TaxID=2775404 RepID=A0ABY5QSQ7_9HYPH|nr:hypothetical protein [Mesorhizobium onobrychidis]UVC13781.1 hypothetical protein IHQ72_24205 [Mesorhizobium onobrychidis]